MRILLLAIAALAAACGSGSAQPEELLLEPSDVDVAYSAELREDPPFVMDQCLVNNLGQRLEGAATAAMNFDGEAAGNSFSHIVASTGERPATEILEEIEALLRDCEPDSDATISSESIMTTTFTYKLVDGPPVGDRALWTSSTLDVSHTSGLGSEGDPSASVIFVKDGVIHRLTAPVTLSWDEGVAFILQHAEKL